MPINFRLAAPELKYVLQDAEVELLFVGDEFLETVHRIIPDLPKLRKIISMAQYPVWRDAQNTRRPDVHAEEADVCLQLYTSGTIGQPKGAQLTNRNVLSALPGTAVACGAWNERDTALIAAPLFHGAGCGTGILGILVGANNIIVRDFLPAAILDILARENVTVALLVPTMIQALLAAAQSTVANFPALRRIVYGASPMPPALLSEALRYFSTTGVTQIFRADGDERRHRSSRTRGA